MKSFPHYSWKTLVVCLIIVFGVGFSGSLLANGETSSSWYESVKPSITPPGWVFPIVWNILFALIALSLWVAWTKATPKQRTTLTLWFGANLVLNALWSLFYFGMHRPDIAFIDLLLLWITIVGMIYASGKIDKRAGWLLVPYLVWVSFAGVLNYLTLS